MTKTTPATLRDGIKTPLALAIVDQVVLSAFSLLLNILLIRLWLPERFGMFVIILSLALICSSVQNALVGSQLSVLRPQALDRRDETGLLTSLWTANCLLMAATVLVSCLVVALIWRNELPLVALSAGLFVAGTLLREYVRSLLFSEFRPGFVLATDLIYVAAAITVLSLIWKLYGVLEVSEILIAMAIASAASGLPTVFSRTEHFSFRLDEEIRTRYAHIWRGQAGWALLGATTYEVMSRAHIFVVGAWFGAAAVGILQAGEMLFRPLVLLVQAWERIAKPTFARLAAARDIAASQALVRISLVGALAMAALFALALWMSWPLLTTHLFRGSYTNIEIVVALWSVAALVQLAAQIYGTELQGFARFGELSAVGIVTSLTALLLLFVAVSLGSFEWSILAIIGGNLVAVALMKATLTRIYQTVRAGLPITSAIAYLPFPIPSGRWFRSEK